MKTIRQQLTRKLLGILVLLISASGIAIYLCAHAALLAQFDAALMAKAQTIISLVEQKNGRLKIEPSFDALNDYHAGGREFLEIWQSPDIPLRRSPSLGDSHLPLRHGLTHSPLVWSLTLADGQPARAIGIEFQPIAEHQTETPPIHAVVVVASDLHPLQRTLMTLKAVLVSCGGILLMTTILLVPRVLKTELVPLHHLAQATDEINAQSLSVRLATANLPGELTPIAERLNELLERLEMSFERERRFSSDVAHELRTPVAELRSIAELSIKFPDTRSEQTDHEILSIALHLENMLKHLLALARGERNELLAQFEPANLTNLVHDVALHFSTKATTRQLQIIHATESPVSAITDPALMRSILTNIIENAIEYAPPQTSVTIKTIVQHGLFAIRVTNATETLDHSDMDCLFDRFWRKDNARSADGHIGLGLPLSRVFAHAIGCQLSASLDDANDLTITLAQVIQPTPSQPRF